MGGIQRPALLLLISTIFCVTAQSFAKIWNDMSTSATIAAVRATDDSFSDKRDVGSIDTDSSLFLLNEANSSSTDASLSASIASIDESVSLYTLPSATNRSYLVGLRGTPKGSNICLGALIKPGVVVSSNCPMLVNHVGAAQGTISSKNKHNILYASIGNRYQSDTAYGETIKIKSWIRDQSYRPKTNAFSIYIFYLEKKSSYAPIQLSGSSIDPMAEGKTATMLGWSSNGFPPFLTLTAVTFYGQTRCADLLKSELKLELNDCNVCIISRKITDACGISHGSPLITTQNGQEVLLGLLNFSYGCGRTDMPSVFTRLTGKSYSWVLKYASLFS